MVCFDFFFSVGSRSFYSTIILTIYWTSFHCGDDNINTYKNSSVLVIVDVNFENLKYLLKLMVFFL